MAIAVFLAAHGIVHWIGFAVPWRLMTSESFAYSTTALWGRLELGETGIRLVALLWLPTTAAFIVAAYGVLRRRSWAMAVTIGAATASLILTLLASPAAVLGVVIDLLILGVAVVVLVRRPTVTDPSIASRKEPAP